MCLESLCALKFEDKRLFVTILTPKTPNGVFLTVFAIFRALKKKRTKNQDRFIFSVLVATRKKTQKSNPGSILFLTRLVRRGYVNTITLNIRLH